MWARGKLADRETHFYHTLTDTIITECVKRGVGTLAVSWPEDVRESDWGRPATRNCTRGRSTASTSTSNTKERSVASRC